LGLFLPDSRLTWLDFDDDELYRHWTKKVSSIVLGLPSVKTARGMHVIGRLEDKVTKVHCLREFGFKGEIRGGNNIVTVPPSKHPRCDHFYSWVNHLPKEDSELPLVSLTDLLPFDGIGFKLTRAINHPKQVPSQCHAKRCVVAFPIVWEIDDSDMVDRIVEDCLPSGLGTRRACLRSVMWRLKRLKEVWSKQELKDVAKKYVARAGSRTRDKSGKETLSCLQWLHDNFDATSGLLEKAVGALPTTELVQVPNVGKYKSSKLRVARLATLCSLMHSLSEDPVWFLSCRDAARIIELKDHSQANDYLKSLERIGLIECVDQGTPGKAVGGLAASFVWLGGLKETKNDIQESISSRVDDLAVAH
jgi:hypothetical protein